MEQLPYIDEHSSELAATPSHTWSALLSVLRSDLRGDPPAAFVRAWRLEPATARGDWCGTPAVGDALPGFLVAEVRENERLAFTGRHRFSTYALVFELESSGPGTSRLRAQTYAVFPGLVGSVYRGLVIGSRLHRLVARRLLRRVGERA